MGYQALLFCPDEKLARVVTQVFGEVEFAVDLVNEPFGAVKKLMAQRYDAVVVDCNDEQNTSLLFKSARNSAFNQSSLAIALVEGQAGVAKAYRIGANLVLTKPINVEQSKGTLRVARGLLRKNSDAASAASHAAPATPSPAASAPPPERSIELPSQPVEAVAFAPRHIEAPEVEAPLPVMAASAQTEEKAVVVPEPGEQTKTGFITHTEAEGGSFEAKLIGLESAKDTAKPASVTAASPSLGTAAAPAPAKEAAGPAKEATKASRQKEHKPLEIAAAVQSQPSSRDSATSFPNAPAFAGLEDKVAGATGRSKKFFLVAVGVIALAAAGYYGWTMLSAAHTNSAPQAVVSRPQQKTTPAVEAAPAPAPATSPALATNGNPSATNPATASKPSAIPFDQSQTEDSQAARIAITPQTESKKAASTPIQVKSGAARPKNPSPTEEPSSPPPNPLAVASQGDADLSGLVASPSSSAQPVLARIKVSQGVSQGLLIKRVQPKYPPTALAAHAEGAVEIEATIDKEGKVVNPKVLSGDRMLSAAALDAVRQWRYKPYYLDGQPVEIQTQITIKFKVE